MKRVVLHLGMHKTGTSFVQAVLYRNAETLKARGVRVVVGAESNRFLNRVEPAEILSDWMDADCSTIVYSNENFVLVGNPERLQLARTLRDTLVDAGAQVTTLIYVRPATEWIPSMWAQYVKIGSESFGVMSLDEFVAEFDYGSVLGAVAELRSEPGTIVRPYLRSAMKNGSILDDFFQVIDLSTDGIVSQVARVNATPSRRQVELARAYNMNRPPGAAARAHHITLLDSFMRSKTSHDPSPSVSATVTKSQLLKIAALHAEREAELTDGAIDSRHSLPALVRSAPERYEANVSPEAIDQYLQNMMILSKIEQLQQGRAEPA